MEEEEGRVGAAVEVHFNAAAGGGCGTEVLFGTGARDRELAEAVQRQLVTRLQLNDRGVKFADYQGTAEADECGWTRDIEGPAIIVEPLFLSDAVEGARLDDPGFRGLIAEGIAAGVWDFLKKGKK